MSIWLFDCEILHGFIFIGSKYLSFEEKSIYQTSDNPLHGKIPLIVRRAMTIATWVFFPNVKVIVNLKSVRNMYSITAL